jgi:nicotinamide phosphoribosyltransferase
MMNKIIKTRLEEAIKNKDFSAIAELSPIILKLLEKPNNLVLLGDAYKYSHPKFYQNAGVTSLYSYLESRGGKFAETVFYGLQIFLKTYLEGVAILKEDVDEAERILSGPDGTFGGANVFDRSRFDYIVEKHGGRLPLRIKAVPEGTVVETHNILMSIESTDENCAWLTNFVESVMLQIWYPITVATLSREVKKLAIQAYKDTSCLPKDIVDISLEFILNDFGLRGVSSVQSAENGGSAHCINFMGSDNLAAQSCINRYYNTDKVYVKSIPATEHSIMTLKGEEGEAELMEMVLDTHPGTTVACVSDSYNILRACETYWGGKLKDKILARTAPLVIRPDSGDPIATLKAVFEILFKTFGHATNDKGFKVLPTQVRVIQGDGVNIDSIAGIYDMFRAEGISAENLVFGMGGKLLQADINRDILNFAFKAAYAIINGKEVNVSKSPTEMDADGNYQKSMKKSKAGRMKLVKDENGCYKTVTSEDIFFDSYKDELVTVFENGEILVEYNFDEIRERAKI